MADVYCKTCKFFQGSALGVCLRYPEQIGKAEHQWCGEHVAKKQHEMLTLPVVEMGESLTVSAEPQTLGQMLGYQTVPLDAALNELENAIAENKPKRRGRPKKGENDVQTSA